jgi:hypothetical protein
VLGRSTGPVVLPVTIRPTILGADPPRAANPSSFAKKRFRDNAMLTGDREKEKCK